MLASGVGLRQRRPAEAETRFGHPPKKRSMNSSTMKGALSPCQSASAEMEPNGEKSIWMGRGESFCILTPEINRNLVGNDAEAGASSILDRYGLNCPTDMTAEAKSRTNRARSRAAGVVSGAGRQPVFQTPDSDESAASRSRPSLHPKTPSARGRTLGVSFRQGS